MESRFKDVCLISLNEVDYRLETDAMILRSVLDGTMKSATQQTMICVNVVGKKKSLNRFLNFFLVYC